MSIQTVDALKSMQPTALMLLVLWLAVLAVLMPREIAFLRAVKPTSRLKFIVLDILLQVAILLVLVPCAVMAQLHREALATVMIGFGLLWIVAIWMTFARQSYILSLLKDARAESERQIRESLLKSDQAQQEGEPDDR